MRATIISIQRKLSQYGGYFFLVSFKGEDGRSYFTYVYPRMRNYKRWKPLLKEGIVLSGLNTKSKNLVDADSLIKEEK
jgi:hypothetical protein